MADDSVTTAVGFYGADGKSSVEAKVLPDGRLQLEIEDRATGANTRTAKIILGPERYAALALVCAAASLDLGGIRKAMERAYSAAGGRLTSTDRNATSW